MDLDGVVIKRSRRELVDRLIADLHTGPPAIYTGMGEEGYIDDDISPSSALEPHLVAAGHGGHRPRPAATTMDDERVGRKLNVLLHGIQVATIENTEGDVNVVTIDRDFVNDPQAPTLSLKAFRDPATGAYRTCRARRRPSSIPTPRIYFPKGRSAHISPRMR